jgi:putative hemolysin|tara:strand:- start:183 stop:377 length:195 start_codon:yes stop_codon:yes gene_type:complete
MNTYIEVTKEAFEAIMGDINPMVQQCGVSNVERTNCTAKGVYLVTITQYYSRPITQYYIQDINA